MSDPTMFIDDDLIKRLAAKWYIIRDDAVVMLTNYPAVSLSLPIIFPTDMNFGFMAIHIPLEHSVVLAFDDGLTVGIRIGYAESGSRAVLAWQVVP